MSTVFAEFVDAGALNSATPAWRDLMRCTAEPNPFADPAFLAPALWRIGTSRLAPVFVWSDLTRTRLIGLAVLRAPPLGLGLAQVWRSEQAGLPACVFDRDLLASALVAIVALLRKRRPGLAGLLWPGLESSAPIATALHALGQRERLRLETLAPVRRAALTIGGTIAFEAGLDAKRRKEWARLARRLAERGKCETSVGVEGAEEFLVLEAKGWKGARKTSLDADPERLAFAREVLGAFEEAGALEIHRLAIDGAPIAMGIVLRAGPRAFYWKTAYDPDFADYSPGVQLTLAISRALAADPGLTLADSCALENHPMIDRIWPARLDLADYALALRPNSSAALGRWLAFEQARRDARERLKRLVYRMLSRKRS